MTNLWRRLQVMSLRRLAMASISADEPTSSNWPHGETMKPEAQGEASSACLDVATEMGDGHCRASWTSKRRTRLSNGTECVFSKGVFIRYARGLRFDRALGT
jgi:hypothetical protein